jgi:hypothetical protein
VVGGGTLRGPMAEYGFGDWQPATSKAAASNMTIRFIDGFGPAQEHARNDNAPRENYPRGVIRPRAQS